MSLYIFYTRWFWPIWCLRLTYLFHNSTNDTSLPKRIHIRTKEGKTSIKKYDICYTLVSAKSNLFLKTVKYSYKCALYKVTQRKYFSQISGLIILGNHLYVMNFIFSLHRGFNWLMRLLMIYSPFLFFRSGAPLWITLSVSLYVCLSVCMYVCL